MRLSLKKILFGICTAVFVTSSSIYAYQLHRTNPSVMLPKITSVAHAETSPPVETTAAGAATIQTARPVPSTTSVPNCTPSQAAQPALQGWSTSAAQLQQTAASTQSYAVYGNTIEQIRAQLSACGPSFEHGKRFAASANYQINWSADFISNGNGLCKVSSSRVGLAVTLTMPAWQSAQTASPAVRQHWQTFASNLAIHENGHVTISKNYALQLLSQLQNAPAEDCTTLSQSLRTRAQAILANLSHAQEAYDQQTDHGATQGAVL